jgi:hypothetical protein
VTNAPGRALYDKVAEHQPTGATAHNTGEHRVGINCLSYETASIDILLGGARAPATPVVNAKTALQFAWLRGRTGWQRLATRFHIDLHAGMPALSISRRLCRCRRHGLPPGQMRSADDIDKSPVSGRSRLAVN